MIDRVSWTQCCLCQACYDACAKKAIHYSSEHYGFKYPVIDEKVCIHCDKCDTVCPVLGKQPHSVAKTPYAFAAQSRNDDVRRESTSGGIFWELACYVLDKGGYVCGAVFDERYHVRHVISNNPEVVRKMRGSKYSQSDLRGIYSQIQHLLKKDELVLFSGCPCQIAAVTTFLGTVPNNLYLIELVCHGVPGDTILQEYIALMEKRYHSKLVDLRFRDKTYGWHRSSVRMEFANGKVYSKPITRDAYMAGFLGGSTLKECCYGCAYKAGRTGCDIVLCDFWGAEKELPEIDDNMGLSGVLVCSEKGGSILESLLIDLIPTEPDSIIQNNINYIEPTKRNPLRDSYFQKRKDAGGDIAIQKFFEESRIVELKQNIRYNARCIYYRIRGKGRPLY